MDNTLTQQKLGFFQEAKEVIKQILTVSSIFVLLKYLAFISFTLISMFLSINMFMRLSPARLEQVVLVTIGGTFELFKVFSIVRGNTLWRLKLKKQAIRSWGMYAILALMSVLASYGFTLTVINRSIQVNSISTTQLQIDSNLTAQKNYEDSIATLETSILTNQTRLASLPVDYVTAAKTLNETISKLQLSITDLQAKLEALRAEEVSLKTQALEIARVETTTSSMFKLIAEGLKWVLPNISETSLMLGLLLLISVLVEIGIISTSPAIPIEQKHLKHFLSEMSSQKTEELVKASQQEKEKPDIDLKRGIKEFLYSKLVPTKDKEITESTLQQKDDKISQTVVKAIKSDTPVIIEPLPKIEEEKAPKKEEIVLTTFEDTLVVNNEEKTADLKREEEKKEVEETFSKASKEEKVIAPIPTRSVPVAAAVAELEPRKVYRFGKTTEAIKDLFIKFVNGLWLDNESGELNSIEQAQEASGVVPALTSVFIDRLLSIKGYKGTPLIEQRADGKLYTSYTREYIISYATAESSRERIK